MLPRVEASPSSATASMRTANSAAAPIPATITCRQDWAGRRDGTAIGSDGRKREGRGEGTL
jgi:hypothetical protein